MNNKKAKLLRKLAGYTGEHAPLITPKKTRWLGDRWNTEVWSTKTYPDDHPRRIYQQAKKAYQTNRLNGLRAQRIAPRQP